MTLDQARAHLEGLRNQWRNNAAASRQRGDEYKAAANAAVDAELRRVNFDESSRFYSYARAMDRDADAITIVLGGRDA